MSELIATVHLADENGYPCTFGPGDEVPAWAEKLITNPKVWSAPVVPAKVDSYIDGMERAKGKSAELPIPPKAGPKATVEVWTAYAKQEIAKRDMKMSIDADASRKDIIEALSDAGIPVGE